MTNTDDTRISPQVRDLSMGADEEAIELFASPVLGHFASVLPASDPEYGYPELMLLATYACARVWGSQNRALKEINKRKLWPTMCRTYGELTGIVGPYPSIPPTAHCLDKFVRRLCADRATLDALQVMFTTASIGLAQALGQFTENVVPDWTAINPDHLIMGDGTYVRPFSAVTECVDAVTGEHLYLGSRAKSKPRIQTVVTDQSEDGKTATGINHVTITTPTRFGWIVLAVAHALGSEIRTATPMIERIVKIVGNGVHTLTWDGAYSGVSKEVLTANHGVLVVNKATARNETYQRTEVGVQLARDECVAMFVRGEPLPLGTSVFPTSSGHDMVRTFVYRIGQLPEVACAHDLWVDGEAIVDVAHDENNKRVKTSLARAVHATRRRLTTGTYAVEAEWSIECPEAGEHRFTTVSEPRSDGEMRSSRGVGEALNYASPIPRAVTVEFAKGYGFRNWTESFNSWFKSRLGTSAGKSRAMRLTQEHQLLDHLSAGLLANAITSWFYEHTDQ